MHAVFQVVSGETVRIRETLPAADARFARVENGMQSRGWILTSRPKDMNEVSSQLRRARKELPVAEKAASRFRRSLRVVHSHGPFDSGKFGTLRGQCFLSPMGRVGMLRPARRPTLERDNVFDLHQFDHQHASQQWPHSERGSSLEGVCPRAV
jgi:hypothetical protein